MNSKKDLNSIEEVQIHHNVNDKANRVELVYLML